AEDLRNCGVGVNLHYIPVHLQPYYQDLGFGVGQYPVAEAYGADAMTLPLYPGLTEELQDSVVRKLTEVLC
ncbi:MAG: UDP-4-amino-4,6-dideoxy-N-acetyl-beta-L-altrosamine transaminase, partial [Acidobacteria bacterium]|nr:UDP-4-amino-4,6-dideoxy-N-acetyl-beta-L-altrosamine transaminase [Acidobacteriota bacterium]